MRTITLVPDLIEEGEGGGSLKYEHSKQCNAHTYKVYVHSRFAGHFTLEPHAHSNRPEYIYRQWGIHI